MGVFNSVLLGKVRGSVGNVTMQNWKGLNTVRTKPTDVSNPNTVAQQNQRARFSILVAISRVLASVFAIGLAKQAIKKTAYNVFVQLNNTANVVDPMDPLASLDLAAIIVAKGSATAISDADAVIEGSNVNAVLSALAGTAPPDSSVLYGCVIRDESNGTISLLGFAIDDMNHSSVTIPCSNTPSATTDRCLLFYVDANTNQPCDSFNIGISA